MQRLLVCVGVAVVIALTVSVLGFSPITMFRPDWLSAAEPIVRPEGTTLEFRNASPVPGELVLEADCIGKAAPQDVTAKLMFTVTGAFFLPSLLLGILIMWVRG
jgi:hypothetical protein